MKTLQYILGAVIGMLIGFYIGLLFVSRYMVVREYSCGLDPCYTLTEQPQEIDVSEGLEWLQKEL